MFKKLFNMLFCKCIYKMSMFQNVEATRSILVLECENCGNIKFFSVVPI